MIALTRRPPAGPILVLLAFLAALIAALVLVHAAHGQAPPPAAWSPHRYVAFVEPDEVYDGDTFTASIATDFGLSLAPRVRLAGLDAPELRGPTRAAGERARAELARLLDGRPVYLEVLTTREGHPVRSFERTVCRAWIERDGRLVDVAELMVQAGQGVRIDQTGSAGR